MNGTYGVCDIKKEGKGSNITEKKHLYLVGDRPVPLIIIIIIILDDDNNKTIVVVVVEKGKKKRNKRKKLFPRSN